MSTQKPACLCDARRQEKPVYTIKMTTLKDTTLSISASRQQRFLKAQAKLKKLVSLLIENYGVNRIILIGSLNERYRFGFHSDIDLCVEGLSDELYFKAIGELLLEADDFDVDIIPFENAPPQLRQKIQQGRVIYDKRRDIS